jgi:hypothetical protein
VSDTLNKRVAASLGISGIATKARRAQVMQKMKANSPANLVKMASNLAAPRQNPDLSLAQDRNHTKVSNDTFVQWISFRAHDVMQNVHRLSKESVSR